MAGNRPEEVVDPPLGYQSWRTMTFLHWRYDPDVIAPHLPAGLTPHVRDGAAWVGLTPFRVEGFRPVGLPALPVVSNYPETNVRTYAVDASGTDGLVFLSLDVDSVASTVAGRVALGVPYQWSDMAVDVDDAGDVHYRCRRRGAGGVGHDLRIRPSDEPLDRDERDLAEWLAGRWRAWVELDGLRFVPVEHEPWPLQRAHAIRVDQTLLEAAGLPAPEGEPLTHFSAGVDTKLGFPKAVAPDA